MSDEPQGANKCSQTAGHRAGPRVCVVGCGRSYRQDDQAGLLVAADISRRVSGRGITVLATESPGADLITYCEGTDLLIVIDAAQAGADVAPGTWTRIDYPRQRERLTSRIRTTTHALSVPEALELAENLDILPNDTWVFAVAGSAFGYGPVPSPDIEEAIPRLAAAVEAEIEGWIGSRAGGDLAASPPTS